MIRKFALLAVAAALMVACGGGTDEKEMDANAMADSAMKMLDQAAEDMKAASEAMVDSANASLDSAKNMMEESKDAAGEMMKEAEKTPN